MPARSPSKELAAQAKFVFQGTVKKLKAATLKEVPVTARTVVVRCDRIVQAPDVLSDYAGQDLTVQLADGEKVKAGETYVFYTNGWIFGEGIAVQSLGHEEATAPAMAALSFHAEDPVRSLRTQEALTQAASAQLIVSGRVAAVRLPPKEARARALAMASGQTTERISEHAPLWQEAVIDIDEVHKGEHGKKQVVIRFPSSTDVRWFKAPKFQPGQEGVFMLHKGQAPAPAAGAKKALAAAAVGSEEYTALDAADFQPLEQLPQLKLAADAAAAPPSPRPAAKKARRASKPARRRGPSGSGPSEAGSN